MKREIEFVRSATRKLRYKGDVTEEEATYIFFLGSVMYAYELGQHFERQYLNNFSDIYKHDDKFTDFIAGIIKSHIYDKEKERLLEDDDWMEIER